MKLYEMCPTCGGEGDELHLECGPDGGCYMPCIECHGFRYIRAEDAERKVRAWDAIVAAGAVSSIGNYEHEVVEEERIAELLMSPYREVHIQNANTSRELVSALRAIKEAT